MGNITTTNRMAILDLIAQADETVEVSSLSQSVTQLQADVISLSASVAGLTGGSSYTYVDENTTDKTFLISITGSTIYDEILLDPNQVIGNTRIKSVDVSDSGNYSGFVSTFDNPTWEIYNSNGSNGNITLAQTTIGLATTNGTNTVSINMESSTGENILASTDGTSTSQISLSPTYTEITINDGTYLGTIYEGVNGNTGIQHTDGISTSSEIAVGINFGTEFAKVRATDGTNTSEIIVNTNQITNSSTDGTNTNILTITPTNLNISNIPAFDDDTAAGTGGLLVGDLYQTTGLGASPLDVAGILMIKQ
jgi:hypothetical protein